MCSGKEAEGCLPCRSICLLGLGELGKLWELGKIWCIKSVVWVEQR